MAVFHRVRSPIRVVVFLALFIYSCDKSDNTIEPQATTPVVSTPVAPSLPTKDALLSVDLSPGLITSQMPLSEEKFWSYSIHVPDELIEGETPLILALHGGNGDHNSGRDFIQCLPLQAMEELKAIIFAPTGGQWWDDLHTQRVVEFVRLAKLHWPIDSNKVAVTGYSNGGTGSVFYAKKFPNTFSAAIPMGADFMEAVCPLIPTYLIHGGDDQFYSPTALVRTVDGLAAGGCDIQLHIVAGADHGAACNMRLELREAAGWLTDVVWKEQDP